MGQRTVYCPEFDVGAIKARKKKHCNSNRITWSILVNINFTGLSVPNYCIRYFVIYNNIILGGCKLALISVLNYMTSWNFARVVNQPIIIINLRILLSTTGSGLKGLFYPKG